MPRGIPWDDLSLFREKRKEVVSVPINPDIEPEPRDFNKDAYNIGKRATFGLVVSSYIIHVLVKIYYIWVFTCN